MWIRSENLLFETSKIQKIFVRNKLDKIEVCISLTNEPDIVYPIYSCNEREKATSILNKIQEAVKLDYQTFDVRLQTQEDRQEVKALYD